MAKGCPDCGELLSGDEYFCLECGHDFRRKHPPVCPECENELSGEEKFCPGCGHDLEDADSPVCFWCDNKLDGNENFCPKCGQEIADHSLSTVTPDKDESAPGASDSNLPELANVLKLLGGVTVILLVLLIALLQFLPASFFCGVPIVGPPSNACAPPYLSYTSQGVTVSGPASADNVSILLQRGEEKIVLRKMVSVTNNRYSYTITGSDLDDGWPRNVTKYRVAVNINNGEFYINKFKSKPFWAEMNDAETLTPTPTATPTPTPTSTPTPTEYTTGSISNAEWKDNTLTVTASISGSDVNLTNTTITVQTSFQNESITPNSESLSSPISNTVVLNLTFYEDFNRAEDGTIRLFINGAEVDSKPIPEPAGGTNSFKSERTIGDDRRAVAATERQAVLKSPQ